MCFNSFGSIFKVTTFGESHGKAIGVVIDGVPSNLLIDIDKDIQYFLNKRKAGFNTFATPRKEIDKVEILSGIFNNKTLGTPIALLIYNVDCKSEDYENIKNCYRPNHGDYSWENKFKIRDYRGGGRSSARETIARVAAGGIARKILSQLNIEVIGALIQIGDISINYNNWNYGFITQNNFFSPDKEVISKWENLLNYIQSNKDSIGAKVELHAKNVPVGLGEPIFDKLDAEIAKSIMSIPAVKAVEIGAGTEAAFYKGSKMADEMYIKNNKVSFTNNFSGGIQGGISNGNDIIVKFTIKPTSSIGISTKTLTNKLEETTVITKGRHDCCIGIRAVAVGEAMLAITLADALLKHRSRANF